MEGLVQELVVVGVAPLAAAAAAVTVTVRIVVDVAGVVTVRIVVEVAGTVTVRIVVEVAGTVSTASLLTLQHPSRGTTRTRRDQPPSQTPRSLRGRGEPTQTDGQLERRRRR